MSGVQYTLNIENRTGTVVSSVTCPPFQNIRAHYIIKMPEWGNHKKMDMIFDVQLSCLSAHEVIENKIKPILIVWSHSCRVDAKNTVSPLSFYDATTILSIIGAKLF